jgi:multiple sugar transport system substrate-binding protein
VKQLFRWTALTFILALALALAACAGAAPTSAPVPTTLPPSAPAATNAPAPTNAPVPTTASAELSGEISFYINEGADELEGFQQLVETFQEQHPKIKINLVNIPDDGEFDKKVAALYAAKTPPDVININYRRFGQFAIKDVLQPVDTYLANSKVVKAADFYPQSLEAFRFQNKQFCIPQNLSSLEVYYNKDLFDRAGVSLPKPGWTWSDFLSAAKTLTKDTNGDGKTDQFGLGMDPATIRLAPFIWAHGGELVDNLDKPTRLAIDSAPALEAFQWFVDLQAKHHVVPSKQEEATLDDKTRFEQGTTAMYLNSRVETPELRETIQEKFEWDVAPLPSDKTTATVLHSDGYCISKDSKNKDLGWAFTEFANGFAGQAELVKTGRTVPSLQKVAESDDFLKSPEPPPSSKIYLDMIPNIRRVPVATTWLEVEGRLDNEIQRAFYGDATVQDAASAAIDGTKEYFKQNLADLGTP